ncbi:MAG: gliding motility protein GldN [Bacteroidota bacterium]
MKRLIVALFVLLSYCVSNTVQAQEVLKPSKYPDGIYTKENTRTRRPISYTSLREADVMWSKRIWRQIDLKQKINHPLYYPTEVIGDRKSLFQAIKDAALIDNSITCFNAMDDEFRNDYTKTDVEGLLSRWDSTHQIDDVNNPGAQILAPVKVDITSDMITGYQIKEDWFFDKQRSVLDVRIIGLLVMTQRKSENGDVVGNKGLFWIYFPEARPVFANQEVYMRHNDAERRTIDDIFWKRLFSSFIFKESNVYNRYIADYTSGLDALLESERIKKEIFTSEHDLWHF